MNTLKCLYLFGRVSWDRPAKEVLLGRQLEKIEDRVRVGQKALGEGNGVVGGGGVAESAQADLRWVVLGGVGLCWVVLGGVGWCWVVLGVVGWCWVVVS